MARLRYIFILILTFACAQGLAAQSKYDNAKVKADRFFQYKEWGSAAAMCNLMIWERPALAEPYARGIVAYEMLGDTIRPMELLDKAMRYGVPLDSVLTGVQRQAYAVGRGAMYEQFMLQAASENKWMKRPLDAYLLRYYAFRQDGPKMAEYARKMLSGAPRNIGFMLTLADGYMLMGEAGLARDVWLKALDIEPDNFNALLCMANLEDLDGRTGEALDYFRHAYRVKPTPYIAEMIDKLSTKNK
ncbi:MAG: hypothetical protein NC102_03320 [Clostridium sp.]|nr:hypothetical protein [Clostridium sp.]